MIAALLVLFAGLGVAGTAAAVGVATAAMSQVDLTRWVASRLRGVPGAAAIIENPGRMLATTNAVTTLGIVFAAAAVPALLAQTTPTFLGVFTVSVGVPLFIGAAYLVPRVVGKRRAEAIVVRAAPWFELVGRGLAPLVPRRDPSPRTTLAAVLSAADTEALAGADEMAVVSAVLAFADRPVRDLMTPRTAIVALPEGMAAGEAAHVCAQTGFSRFPTYRGSLDEVTGVVHAIDLLALQPEDPVLVRPVLTVPGTMRAADLMLDMQRGRSHMATVLDEFGGTAGLVTLEDLLSDLVEEIFGDHEESPPPASPDAPLLEVEGNAPAERLHEVFGVAIRGRDVQTVGGLLVHALGRIPRPGERLQLRGLDFDILAATSTRVERVLVRKGPVRAVSLDRTAD